MPPGIPRKSAHICIKSRDVISQPSAVACYSGIGKRPAVEDETGKSESYKNKEKTPMATTTLSDKKIAIMVANGFDEARFIEIQKMLLGRLMRA